ncbi:MAG TPA: hypothetical protein VHP11_13870 [Tepidisphaeraceae bacterium]|nr:hypothetical protein [Tepidisphaeraceae bacterium]
MKSAPWLAATVLTGGFLGGCCCHHHHDQEPRQAFRQEGDLATQDWTELTKGPYSAILGDTTGGGLPRDVRTGGGITGNDVTVYQRLKAKQARQPSDDPPPDFPSAPPPSPDEEY